MAKLSLIAAISMSVLLLTLCFASTVSSADDVEMEYHPWSMANGDAGHSGVSPYVMEEMPEDVFWERDLSETPTQDIAVGTDGTIYIVEGSTIDGLSHDGQWTWTFDAGSPITSTIAIDSNGFAFFMISDPDTNAKSLVMIDHEGTLVWQSPLTYSIVDANGTTTKSIVNVSSPVVGPNGTVYFSAVLASEKNGTENRYAFYEVSYEGENVLMTGYKLASDNDILAKTAKDPAISANGTVLFVGGNEIYALAHLQWCVWSFALPGSENSSVELISDLYVDPEGNSYFISEGAVFSIDADGDMRWIYDIPVSGGISISSVSSQGVMADVADNEQALLSILMISPEGTLEWTYNVDVETSAGDVTVVTADGLLIICGKEAIVGVAPNGTEAWRSDVATPNDEEIVRTFLNPVLGDNDTLYVLAFEDGQCSVYVVGNWLDEAVYNLVLLFSLAFAPFFIIAACYLYLREEDLKK